MTLQPFQASDLSLAGASTSDLPIGVQNIVAWSGVLNAASSLVEALIDTPFVPTSFWPLPNGVQIRDFPNPAMKHPRESAEEHAWRRQVAIASASAAVMLGGQVGFDPLVALSSIYVVRGRPGMYAEAMVALLKSHGHELVLAELTDSRCVMRGRRKGESDWQHFEFTMDRANKAGYAKQNPKYGNDPQTMLYARCSSIGAKTIAPDVLKGIAVAELLDDEPLPGEVVNAPKTRTVKPPAQRAAVTAAPASGAPSSPASRPAAAQSGPPLPGEDDQQQRPTTDVSGSPELVTDAQLRKLGAVFSQLGVKGAGERADRLGIASAITGRPLDSSKELTVWEAGHLIDQLEQATKVPAADADAWLDGLLGRGQDDDGGGGPAGDDVDVEDPPAGWDGMDGAEADAEASRG